MTATERVFRRSDYGKRFFQLSYKEAIVKGIISDYEILTIPVSDEDVARVIKENRILSLRLGDLDESEARTVAAGVALKRVGKMESRTQFRSTPASVRRSSSGVSRMP
jgi:predicted helicase